MSWRLWSWCVCFITGVIFALSVAELNRTTLTTSGEPLLLLQNNWMSRLPFVGIMTRSCQNMTGCSQNPDHLLLLLQPFIVPFSLPAY